MERLPAEVPFVSLCGCRLSLAYTPLVLPGLDADAGAGRLLLRRPSLPQRELPVWEGAVSTPPCASVSVRPSASQPCVSGAWGWEAARFAWQECSAATVQLCPGARSLVTVPLQ